MSAVSFTISSRDGAPVLFPDKGRKEVFRELGRRYIKRKKNWHLINLNERPSALTQLSILSLVSKCMGKPKRNPAFASLR